MNKNISSFPRDTWFYEVARFYLNPKNDVSVQKNYKEEKNRIRKKRILFYISVQQLLLGKTNTARTGFLEVSNLERKDLIEYDLATWELEKTGGKIDW